jgi:hypothetical protein
MIIVSNNEYPWGAEPWMEITYYDEHTMECVEHGEIYLAHPTGRHCPHCGKSLQMAMKTARYPKYTIFVDVNCEQREA